LRGGGGGEWWGRDAKQYDGDEGGSWDGKEPPIGGRTGGISTKGARIGGG